MKECYLIAYVYYLFQSICFVQLGVLCPHVDVVGGVSFGAETLSELFVWGTEEMFLLCVCSIRFITEWTTVFRVSG